MATNRVETIPTPPAAGRRRWLNRSVIGMAVTSFLSDAGHEMVTAVLPGFLSTLGIAAAALGWIEGVSDASSSFVKLGAGWYSDRIGHRKAIVSLGYFLTGTALALFAAAISWPLILLGRVVSWFGRGIRSPLRDAMLAESVAPEVRGKAFGLHRAGDTMGAIVGPLLGVWLLSALPHPNPSAPFRTIFLVSLIPGLASVLAFALLVQEKRRPANRSLQFWGALRDLPKPYTRFLQGVGVFGLGDFSHTLLILAATQLLTPVHGSVRASEIAALLYVLRNAVYAAASYSVGVLADAMDKTKLLATGYLLGVLTAAMMAGSLALNDPSLTRLVAVFSCAGIYIAIQDALEGAIPADLVPAESRGTAYGLMGTVNGVGDLTASVLVGTLWTAASPAIAFDAAAAVMIVGSLLLIRNWRRTRGWRA
ncbi:MAG TPA: MFS transporter [Bryobacteraceae bacterium]|jgi:MFS family permease|nr:MFS transporter [Bryobacteraceae bacterium]